jgi:hypothetical protein
MLSLERFTYIYFRVLNHLLFEKFNNLIYITILPFTRGLKFLINKEASLIRGILS